MSKELTPDSIPHRPPFRFVDQIEEVSQDRIRVVCLADRDADFFRGHYPNEPIMPGVLICECCFQAGALLMVHRGGGSFSSDSMPVVTRIQDARFKRMVKPGDQMDIEVTLDDFVDTAFYMTGRVTVNKQLVVRVGFVCMQVVRESTAT